MDIKDKKDIKEIFIIFEENIKLELEELEQMFSNLKKVNIELFTDEINAEIEQGLIQSKRDLIQRIKELLMD